MVELVLISSMAASNRHRPVREEAFMKTLGRIVIVLLVPLTVVSGLAAKAGTPAHATTTSSHATAPHKAALYRKMPLLGAAGQRLAHSVTASSTRASAMVPTAEPPYPCTPPNSGDRWTDPDTGENLVCRCFYYWENNQIYYDCEWVLEEEEPDPSTWVDLNSGLYMDVEGVSQNNGARIHQWTYTGAGNQWWGMHTSPCGCGTGFVNSTSVNSGKCLGVSGGSLSQGASIVQWSCNGHPDQTWLWIYTGYTTSTGWPIWNILDENSGMCLGISGGSTSRGAYAIQWGCNGHADQAWF
jgi:Ricin-type beta-trefoil lectin domain